MTIDLPLDLNTQDETGLPWTFLDEAPDPSRIVQGAWIVVGGPQAQAVAQVEASSLCRRATSSMSGRSRARCRTTPTCSPGTWLSPIRGRGTLRAPVS